MPLYDKRFNSKVCFSWMLHTKGFFHALQERTASERETKIFTLIA